MNDKRSVAEKLLQINAIKLSPDKPFTWASGWKSPIYCDNRMALSFPMVRDAIVNEMCNMITKHQQDCNLLAGVATAGIAWGAIIADKLHLPYIYVRPKPKEHGLGNQIEGFYEKGMKPIVIEDLISTGKSSLLVVNVLRQSGLQVNKMVSIFNYGLKQAEIAFKQADIETFSVTDYDTLLNIAIEKQIIQKQAEKMLLSWKENPQSWGI